MRFAATRSTTKRQFNFAATSISCGAAALFQSPEFLEPEFLEPEFLEPEFLEPEFLEPEFLEPEFLEPEFLEPEFLEPEFLEPEFLEPEFLEPEFLESAPNCKRVAPQKIASLLSREGHHVQSRPLSPQIII